MIPSALPVPVLPALGNAGGYPPALPAVSAAGSVSAAAANAASGAAGGGDTQALREVAQGFEAMLLRQMLEAAGKADFGGEELFGSSSEDTFKEMRDARFADIAAAQGSLGLAAQIEAQLARYSDSGAAG